MEAHEHHHHRARIRRRFLASDPRTLDDYQLLEVLLFYAIPRQDTNPIAHRLMKEFGSLERILEADPKELQKVPGVGPKCCALLAELSDYVRRCFLPDPVEHTPTMRFYDDFLRSIRREMNALDEGLWVLTLDARWRMIGKTLCPKQELADCLRPILAGHGVRIVLLWNYHEYQKEKFPSKDQLSFAKLLYYHCRDLEITVELCARIAGPIAEYQTPYDWER